MRSLGQKVDLLRVIAHPVRIRILEELVKGVKCVSDFKEILTIPQPNLSQHLGLLRNNGVIDYYIDGRLRCYFLVDPIIPDLLETLRRTISKPFLRSHAARSQGKGNIPGKEDAERKGGGAMEYRLTNLSSCAG